MKTLIATTLMMSAMSVAAFANPPGVPQYMNFIGCFDTEDACMATCQSSVFPVVDAARCPASQFDESIACYCDLGL
jgi:hypothetical protein